jgi:hypothetical protein
VAPVITSSVTGTPWVVEPVPVTVSAKLPGGVPAPVVIVIVEVPPALVTAAGLNTAVAPGGNPDALNVTCCGLPLVSVAVIVEDPEVPPWVAVTEVGFADSAKSSSTGAVTVSVTITVLVHADAPEPVTVIR